MATTTSSTPIDTVLEEGQDSQSPKARESINRRIVDMSFLPK